MAEDKTNLLNQSYSRESRTDFPGKRESKNRRDPGKSGTGNPGNETLVSRTQNQTTRCLVAALPTSW
jgi:hypothetical protein